MDFILPNIFLHATEHVGRVNLVCIVLYWQYMDVLIPGSLRSVHGVANADVRTLFSQYTDPASASRYFMAGFRPRFLSPSDYTVEQKVACTPVGSSTLLQECLYDYAVSGSRAFAMQNIDMAKSFADDQRALGE